MKPVSEILQGGVADSPITDLVRRSSSPQARHHFTRADQVNQLVGASETDPRSWLSGADDGTVQSAQQ